MVYPSSSEPGLQYSETNMQLKIFIAPLQVATIGPIQVEVIARPRRKLRNTINEDLSYRGSFHGYITEVDPGLAGGTGG